MRYMLFINYIIFNYLIFANIKYVFVYNRKRFVFNLLLKKFSGYETWNKNMFLYLYVYYVYYKYLLLLIIQNY